MTPRPSTIRRAASGCLAGALLALSGAAHAQATPYDAASSAAPASTASPGTSTVAGAPLATATAAQKQRAGAAYAAGMERYNLDKYDEALAKFRESYSIVASPNSRLMIARSLHKLGRSAEAYRELNATMVEADAAAATSARYKPTAAAVREDLAELDKALAFVTVQVVGSSEEAKLSVAGRSVDRSEWGKPIPVEPGSVTVEVSTLDGTTTTNVQAVAGGRATVAVEVPTGRDPLASDGPRGEGRGKSSYSGPDRKTMGYVALGVGGASFIVAGAFGALTSGQYSRLQSACPAKVNCDASLEDIADRGRTYQVVTNVGLGLGVAGVATGIGLIVWDGIDGGSWPWEGGEEKADTGARLLVGPGHVGVAGSF